MRTVAEYRITLRTGDQAREEDVEAAAAALAEAGATRKVRALAAQFAVVAREHLGVEVQTDVRLENDP